ncbi:MAG TPA: hypothetical protein VLX30_10065 [Burkholderiales bacterium]|nr:hypothetical protein [Burkholderiales bacterium]
MSDEPDDKRFSPVQIGIAGLGAAIVLVLIMILLSISGLMSG